MRKIKRDTAHSCVRNVLLCWLLPWAKQKQKTKKNRTSSFGVFCIHLPLCVCDFLFSALILALWYLSISLYSRSSFESGKLSFSFLVRHSSSRNIINFTSFSHAQEEKQRRPLTARSLRHIAIGDTFHQMRFAFAVHARIVLCTSSAFFRYHKRLLFIILTEIKSPEKYP